jgi:chromosome segregation ATPase
MNIQRLTERQATLRGETSQQKLAIDEMRDTFANFRSELATLKAQVPAMLVSELTKGANPELLQKHRNRIAKLEADIPLEDQVLQVMQDTFNATLRELKHINGELDLAQARQKRLGLLQRYKALVAKGKPENEIMNILGIDFATFEKLQIDAAV